MTFDKVEAENAKPAKPPFTGQGTLTALLGRLEGSSCPQECPEDCYTEARPDGKCQVCGGHGVMWQSHGRPWIRCGYCRPLVVSQ